MSVQWWWVAFKLGQRQKVCPDPISRIITIHHHHDDQMHSECAEATNLHRFRLYSAAAGASATSSLHPPTNQCNDHQFAPVVTRPTTAAAKAGTSLPACVSKELITFLTRTIYYTLVPVNAL